MQAYLRKNLVRAVETNLQSEELLASLRGLHRSLEADSDSYRSWLGLYEIFMMMNDARRAARCLRVARHLRASALTGASAVTAPAG